MTSKVTSHYFALLLLVQSALTLVISLGLPGLEFHDGMPLPEVEIGANHVEMVGQNGIITLSLTQIGKILLVSLFLGWAVFFCYRLTSKLSWSVIRRSLTLLAFFLFLSGAIYCLLMALHMDYIDFTAIPVPVLADPVRSPLGAPPLLIYWFAGGILILFAVVLLYSLLHSPDKNHREKFLLEKELLQIDKTLRQGGDLANAVLICYGNMSRIVKKEQAISRDLHMTAEEFKDRILSYDIPEDPVIRLTHLFEKIRYGNNICNLENREEAQECLREIINYFAKEQRA